MPPSPSFPPSAQEIRQAFLDYFVSQDHKHLPSGPLVPEQDPSLLFTSAGMVPFKNIFTGRQKAPVPRAVTAQKCLRAGGKHNDLENVGHTSRHHTFFEMLGNFSFGDYFKERAIVHAWHLVTQIYALSPQRLLVTVYAEDEEAARLWKKISGLPAERILPIATSDNFWSMGASGPCGPCSEIFYDHGPHIPGGPPGSPEEDGERFVEIWNLVFMQYEQGPKGRQPLPNPAIDTGMGLERITAVLQGHCDNYATDLFQPIIAASAAYTGHDHGAVGHRVIADHLRAACFLLAEGIAPGNEGRGYVLRRILRRAIRHAHQLGSRTPLLDRLAPLVITQMGPAYPELIQAQDFIRSALACEEERFRATLKRGLTLLNKERIALPAGADLPGAVAFRLYDTYGFPLDLTQDILRTHNRGVALEGFTKAMEEQKRRARQAWRGSGDEGEDSRWLARADAFSATAFVGYQQERISAQIQALIVDGQEQDCVRIADGEAPRVIEVLVNQSPFYAQAGGQQADHGYLVGEGGGRMEITDVYRRGGRLSVHLGRLQEGSLRCGEEAILSVDGVRRRKLSCHHSATHLLHAAIREIVGAQVTQRGSLVAADRLRFDVAAPRAISREQRTAIEARVNEEIRANTPVTLQIMSLRAARAQGALALFGEKYDQDVRVITMGRRRDAGDEPESPDTPENPDTREKPETAPYFSRELCGGTHVAATGEIGHVCITTEQALAAGVRRIEARAGESADQHARDCDLILHDLATTLKVPVAQLPERVHSLAVSALSARQQHKSPAVLRGEIEEIPVTRIGEIALLSHSFTDLPVQALKSMVDHAKQRWGSGIFVFTTTHEARASLVVGVTADLAERFSAAELARIGGRELGGKGGGRRDLAQAGGPKVAALPEAQKAITENIQDAYEAWASVDRGFSKASLDRYEEAIADFDAAIRRKPDLAEAWHNRGLSKARLSRHEEAIADSDEAIRLKSDLVEAWVCRAITKKALGRYKEAIADFDAAIRLKPDFAEPWGARGFSKAVLGRHEEALADFGEAIRLKLDDAEAWGGRGFSQVALDRHEEAIADLNEAIRLKPDLAESWGARGSSQAALGRHEKAIEDFDEVIRLKPNYAEGFGSRGFSQARLDRHEEAIADLDAAIRLKPDFAEALNNRGISKGELGRDEEAIADYNETIRLKPDFAGAWNNRGVSKAALGRHEEAIADFDEVIRLKPDDAEAWYNRGVIKGKLGRHKAAIADYNETIRLKPDFAGAWYNCGVIKGKLGRYEEALEDFNEAIRLRPDLAEAWNNRGISKGELGHYEAALADFDEAIRLKPDLAAARRNYDLAEKRLDNEEDAQADYAWAEPYLANELLLPEAFAIPPPLHDALMTSSIPA